MADYDLAFEGGGAKGLVFIGALQELERRGHRGRRFVGTSAGALVAALLAAGHDAAGLERAMAERLPDGTARLATFLDAPSGFSDADVRQSALYQLLARIDVPLIPDAVEARLDRALVDGMLAAAPFRMLFSLLEKGGPYAGDRLRAWLAEQLDVRQPGLGAASFAELADRTGRDLTITVSDTSGEEMLVLNSRTAPDCPVVWAVRASMSIPFVFQEVVWQPAWGAYRGRDLSGHVLIDGGVLSNFPIRLLASGLEEIQEVMGDAGEEVPNLGLLIDERLAVEGGSGGEAHRGAIDGLFELKPLRRLERIMETVLNAHDRAVIDASLALGEVCRLPARGYSALDFGMSDARRQALIAGGRRAMAAHFDRAA